MRWGVRTVRDDPEAGSTLPELIVAAALTVVAGAMTVAAVSGPVGRLHAALDPDLRRTEVDTAAEVVARVLRAANPRSGPPVRADAAGVAVTVGPPSGDAVVTLRLEDRALVLESSGSSPGAPDAPTGVLIDAVDAFGIDLVDDEGRSIASGQESEAVATVMRLEAHGVRATRIVALRALHEHDGVEGW